MAKTEAEPAQIGAIDYDKLGAAVAKSLSAPFEAMTSAQAKLAERLEKMATPATPAEQAKPAAADAPKYMTGDDLVKALEARDQRQQQSAARGEFIAKNLGKLPAAYQAQLGNDPAQWATQAASIQSTFEGDFKANGGKVENVGGASKDGGNTAANQPQDYSKISGQQLIREAFAGDVLQPGNATASK